MVYGVFELDEWLVAHELQTQEVTEQRLQLELVEFDTYDVLQYVQ